MALAAAIAVLIESCDLSLAPCLQSLIDPKGVGSSPGV